jgi:hypothetical protein
MLELETLVLGMGSHVSREDGMCAMEAVAWLAGEPHSDHPICACPVIAHFVRRVNDRLLDGPRNRILKPLLHTLVGSKATKEIEIRRGFAAADYAVRVFAPRVLDRSYSQHAIELRAIPPIINVVTARAGQEAATAAAAAAHANIAAMGQDILACIQAMLEIQ